MIKETVSVKTIVIIPSELLIEISEMVLIVDFFMRLLSQKLLKSCSPIRYPAAFFIASIS